MQFNSLILVLLAEVVFLDPVTLHPCPGNGCCRPPSTLGSRCQPVWVGQRPFQRAAPGRAGPCRWIRVGVQQVNLGSTGLGLAGVPYPRLQVGSTGFGRAAALPSRGPPLHSLLLGQRQAVGCGRVPAASPRLKGAGQVLRALGSRGGVWSGRAQPVASAPSGSESGGGARLGPRPGSDGGRGVFGWACARAGTKPGSGPALSRADPARCRS